MSHLKYSHLPDENIQVGSTNTSNAPVKAVSKTFFPEGKQDMEQYSQKLATVLPAGSAKLALSSESLSPEARHSPLQGEEPDKTLPKLISPNKLTNIRYWKKVGLFLGIISTIVAIANNSVQLWQNLLNNKNYSPLPSSQNVRLESKDTK